MRACELRAGCVTEYRASSATSFSETSQAPRHEGPSDIRYFNVLVYLFTDFYGTIHRVNTCILERVMPRWRSAAAAGGAFVVAF